MKKLIIFFMTVFVSVSLWGQTASDFRAAAERGDATAQCNLGTCYFEGYGVEKNYSEAVKWYRKAAEQGFAEAQYNLGVCYYEGYGVEKNYSEAVKWYRKAAEQGFAEAQYNLGACYYEGHGVEKDGNMALYWMEKAIDNETLDDEQAAMVSRSIAMMKSQGYSSSRANINSGGSSSNSNNSNSSREEYSDVLYKYRGIIEKVWLEHNVTGNDRGKRTTGMNIHVRFTIEHTRKTSPEDTGITAYFFWANGNKLKDTNGRYKTEDGQVFTGREFNLKYNNTRFRDFVVFMPYSELHLGRGRHNLKMSVCIIFKNKFIAQINNYRFTVNH